MVVKMADLSRVTVPFLLTILSINSALSSKDGVPVLLWGSKLQTFPDALAGHTLEKENFQSAYLQKLTSLKKNNIVAFIQDKLSLDDITQNADVYNEQSDGATFHNLKAAMEKHSSTHLESVLHAADGIRNMAKTFVGKVHHLEAPYTMDSVPIDESQSNLVIVHLPPTGDTPEQTKTALGKADNIIGSVTSDLNKLKSSFVALYTADDPSTKIQDEHLYLGRHLLAAEDEYTFVNISNCIYFYAKEIIFETYKMENSKRTLQSRSKLTNPDSSDSSCSKNGTGPGELVLKYTPENGSKALSFIFELAPAKYGYWDIKNFTATYDKKVARFNSTMKGTPDTFSWSCYDPVYTEKGSEGDTFAQFKFIAMQIQFGTIKNGQFGMANNCVAFFTIGIWSGIIVTLLLASILAGGLCMIANIKTPDRFDDPKGKTITVNVPEGQ